MPGWFRAGLPPHQTALAMLGAKPGQRVVFLGANEPGVAAEIARVTGLNGHTIVADTGDAARGRVEEAAARVGALIEVHDTDPSGVPESPGTFDLAAVTTAWLDLDGPTRAAIVAEASRLVRPGGRMVVMIAGGRKPVFGKPPNVPRELADEAVSLLAAAGARATRVLAEVPGATYVEGVKPRITADT